jgi:hypothetical protein
MEKTKLYYLVKRVAETFKEGEKLTVENINAVDELVQFIKINY